MRPYLITAKLMRPSNMKRFPTPDIGHHDKTWGEVKAVASNRVRWKTFTEALCSSKE
jgi:hypothetical protein